MRPYARRFPPADGGNTLDGDRHRMADDGGPTAPDPARWADPDWRDNLGEGDTFAREQLAETPVAAIGVTVRRPTDTGLSATPPPDGRTALGSGVPPGDGPLASFWPSVRVEGDPTAVWTIRRAGDGGPLDL